MGARRFYGNDRWHDVPRRELRNRASNHPGFTLIELMAATALLVTFVAVLVPMFQATVAQRRSIERRQAATLEAANALERVSALGWDELTAERAAAIRLSEEARQTLPGGELKLEFIQTAGEPDCRRIVVEVGWEPQPGQPRQTVRLAAWRFFRRSR